MTNAWETPCPDPRSDGKHCRCWYDGGPCCYCGAGDKCYLDEGGEG